MQTTQHNTTQHNTTHTMIVNQERLGSLALLGRCQGSVVPAIIPKIILAAAVGVLAKLVEDGFLLSNHPAIVKYSFEPFTALGVAISLFLGFHNNASFDRWWEARILWGTQIIVIRNLIRFLLGSLSTTDDEDDDDDDNNDDDDDENKHNNTHDNNNNNINNNNGSNSTNTTKSSSSSSCCWRRDIIRLSMAQTHALRAQLRPRCRQDRPGSALQDRNRFLTPREVTALSRCQNPAHTILHYINVHIGKAHHHRRKDIDSYQMIQLSKLVDELCTIQTSCERIHNTSLPLAYSLLVHRTATFYVLLVPFAIVDRMGWWTPLFTAIVGYTFYGLDELARQIQSPFQDEPACLALSAMCRTIEIDVAEALHYDTIPPALKPIKSILM